MKTSTLLRRNLAFYWRTNLAVIFGVAAATAVLAGALVVGDSVRASLRELFLQRIGRTAHVVTASGFFREQLADEIRADERFTPAGFTGACPLVVLEGAVAHEETGRRASGVAVYGVDERFWQFHARGAATELAPRGREVLTSPALAEELRLGAGEGEDVLLLRVEKPSAIPAESVHGRKEDLGRTIRLTSRGALAASLMGEFSARPQQTSVRAVFVPLRLLQQDLEQDGRVNALLVSAGDGDDPARNRALETILRERASLEDLGIRLRALDEQGSIALETESSVISDALAETATAAAAARGMSVSPVLSYLANSIRTPAGREIPYSLVTAVGERELQEIIFDTGRVLVGALDLPRQPVFRPPGAARRSTPQGGAEDAASLPPIVLNEWAAADLGVQRDDQLTLEYYVWKDDNRLATESARFRVTSVIPIRSSAADRDLVPAYPGITESESISEWDPPFPVELRRIRPQDEEYWKKYRTTPKAFVTLGAVQGLWRTRFGGLTSLRIRPGPGRERPQTPFPQPTSFLQRPLEEYRDELKRALNPTALGVAVFAARAEGLEASRGATDFGEYFLYFSFFIVVSALMLTVLFFRLGVEQRLREIGILRAVGFPPARVRSIFLAEGLALSLVGCLLGAAGALAYAWLVMTGLRTWWVGAVGTTALELHASPRTLALGAVAGVLAALACVVWTLWRLRLASARSMLSGAPADVVQTRAPSGEDARRGWRTLLTGQRLGVVFLCLGVLLLVAASFGLVGQAAGFFGGGTLLLVALLVLQAAWLKRGGRLIHGRGPWAVARLGFRSATHRPGRSTLCIALIASAAFIIVAVDAFRRDTAETSLDRKSGTGGYALMAETLLPVIQDPNTPEGREALNLSDDADALEGVQLARFRLRPGDDASCLNLYQPRRPRILAPAHGFLAENRFTFQSSSAATDEERANPWLLLERETQDGTVPVVADANSLTYVMHLSVGDEFALEREGAEPLRLRVVGALSDSVFQGELLMSEKNFLKNFPDEQGHRVFMLDAPAGRADGVAALLETRLADFGFDAQSTAERLAGFHRVENTFLSTFQMLGGLGLVLGTLGLSAVLLRNVLERRRELAMLRAVGYGRADFALMILAENALLLLCGLLTGTLCALLAVGPVSLARGGQLPVASVALLLAAVVLSGLLASLLATAAALRAPLIATLRAE